MSALKIPFSLRRIWVLAMLLASCPLGCGPKPEPPEESPPAPVQVVRAVKQALDEWIELPGTTQPLPRHAARVTAAVEGRVLAILPETPSHAAVIEGQHVEEGQVIVKLDDRVLKAKRAQMAANQKDLKEQRQQAENTVQLNSQLVRAGEEANRDRTGNTLLVPEIEMKTRRTNLRNAESQLRGVQAKQESGKAGLKALDEELRYYTLKAPIAGYLSPIQVVLGQTIAVGTVVADIVDLDQIDVLCFAPPSRVKQLELGQPARVLTADTREPATASGPEGRVVYIAVQAEAQTGSFAVKVRFPNQKLGLRANALVRVQIRTQPPKERLVIPSGALMEDQQPPGVIVVQDIKTENGAKTGEARLLQVVTGVRDRQRHRVEVRELLKSEEEKEAVPPMDKAWFVVTGGHGLKTGDVVKIAEKPEKEKK